MSIFSRKKQKNMPVPTGMELKRKLEVVERRMRALEETARLIQLERAG